MSLDLDLPRVGDTIGYVDLETTWVVTEIERGTAYGRSNDGRTFQIDFCEWPGDRHVVKRASQVQFWAGDRYVDISTMHKVCNKLLALTNESDPVKALDRLDAENVRLRAIIGNARNALK